MMLIYTLIFGVVFHASEQYFPVFIFIGITMWGFFSRSVSGSVNTVRASRGIITKIYMPKYILLLSKMFVNGFKMMISFAVVRGPRKLEHSVCTADHSGAVFVYIWSGDDHDALWGVCE